MSRLAIILAILVASISATTLNSSLDQLNEQVWATEIEFTDAPVIEIMMIEGGTVNRTFDPIENVTEVYNKATDTTTTSIVFDQPLHIEG